MMKKFLLFFLALFFFNHALQAEEAPIALEKAPVNLQDQASIIRGAKFFASICMACHTLVYMRYNTLAHDAGVIYEKMPINVKNWPQGITPPDLSLTADERGVDWIYTYLHSFYVDTSRPSGVNNLLVPGTAMPGIVMAFQGSQMLAKDTAASHRIMGENLQWYDLLEQQADGTMTSEQFDQTMLDVVNFLAYAAEPFHEKQVRLGYWVIGFLIILFVLVYALKKSYWRDIKESKKSKK